MRENASRNGGKEARRLGCYDRLDIEKSYD